MRVADFDGDGRPDLLVTGTGADLVVWYEHPGSDIDRPWRRHVIDDASTRPVHGQPVDLDCDGGVDVVMPVGMGRATATGSVVWYGHGGDPRGPWTRHVICEHLPQAFEAVAADLDGDGQVEVVATAWGRQGGLWVFKHGGDPRGVWRQQALKENWVNANQVIVADIDGDGRLDILAQAERGSNELRWWRNPG